MGFITDLLKEVPLSAVLREKLATADTKIESLEKENADLRQLVKEKDGEIDRLKQEVERLRQRPDEPVLAGWQPFGPGG
jgi:predicted RNase H-like nuclease (RuvC/YqgF family)